MHPSKRSSPSLLAALLLAACGGGGGLGNSDSGVPAAPPRGTMLQNPLQLLSTLTAPSLLLELNPDL
jgi:hypothetical protein